MTADTAFISRRGEDAERFFREGYNCAQAVAAAFAPDTGTDRETLLRFNSSFGGGIGRMREVCGAVSGMCGIAGLLYGYADPKDGAAKKKHYARIQELAGKFRDEHGSILCRELLAGVPGDTGNTPAPKDGDPSERGTEWYKKRPCAELVRSAAESLAEYITTHPERETPSAGL
ncbi:MAG: C-GCAxxG-C-C family protein [Spirochaetaceae bacterium]|jgi:C_GCAxxG_C_C family probable redox protein|nr:C-GCAxxG-C-C family protein [Spirochaetaceae bacterium]